MHCLLVIFFLASAYSSQDDYSKATIVGEGPPVEQKFEGIGPFKKIFASVGTVYLNPLAPKGQMIVCGQQNILDALSISVFNNVLYIRSLNPLWLLSSIQLSIFVGIANCPALSLDGNVNYIFSKPLAVPKFELELSGKATCSAWCNVNELYLKMSGAAELTCAGTARQYELLLLENSFGDLSQLHGNCVYRKVTKNAEVKTKEQL